MVGDGFCIKNEGYVQVITSLTFLFLTHLNLTRLNYFSHNSYRTCDLHRFLFYTNTFFSFIRSSHPFYPRC